MKPIFMTVQTVADWVGGAVEGNPSLELDGIAPLESAGARELTFATDEKWAARLSSCKAAAAIVGKVPPTAPMTLIRVKDVQVAVAELLSRLAAPQDRPAAGIDKTAIIAPDAQVAPDAAIGPQVTVSARAKIGARCSLGAGAYIGADVELGQDVVLDPGVVIRYGCVLGDRVQIGANAVIGYDGFGYYTAGGVHHKIPHVGNVVIEDDVEIGACSCVDRAKFGSTRIGAGTKIDNLVQVAHNVQIGRGCILASMVGVAGSAKLGDYCIVMGNAGIRDNIKLGNGVKCSAFAAVAADVPDGGIVAGIPAAPARDMFRIVQATAKLPETLKRIRDLEARLAALESSKHNQ